ncbi:MAG TPA: DPP IV N-terminal domain-containing protein, partial [Gemmatimonadaceae bacterium]|nr:DPP IV N-terminal domain-containing protein [Gemmatimonadaceae bacterium]
MRLRRLASILLLATPVARSAVAQGTAADYARSDGLRARTDGKVIDAADAPTWVPGSDLLVYRKSVSGGNAFMLVDATTLQKRPAFDHDRLAAAFSTARDTATPRAAAPARPITGATLPFTRFAFVDSARAIEFSAGARPGETANDSTRWRCSLTTYACRTVPREDPVFRGGARGEGGGLFGERRSPPERPKISPDGKWEALVRNYNVSVRPNGSRDGGVMLGVDGTEGEPYDPQSITWSPDSKHIAAFRVKPGYRREVHYIQSSPEDQLQPKQASLLYNKPGDLLDVGTPAIFDVEKRSEIVVDRALFPNAYNVTALEWRADSHSVTFEYNQRGHQVYRVIEIDAATGATRAIIDERMPTFFEYSAKKYRFDVNDGKEIIWMSERDGWNHLYLYDGKTGKVKNQITKGPWVVRGVDWVDTTRRQIYFTASGMKSGTDPYFVEACKINFDGSGLTTLTDGDANHSVTYSPDHRYVADLSSRVDLPPRLQLRSATDGKVLGDLERADASALLGTGWKPPEVFVAKGRDGTTDIWGVVIRPTNFDSTKKYPVIENIYAGPQGSFVPKTFSTQLAMQSLAELGFIVVQIDGMGTSNRSKAFHDVAYKNLGDAGFPDRILWHKAV